jgi:hypothetical protein
MASDKVQVIRLAQTIEGQGQLISTAGSFIISLISPFHSPASSVRSVNVFSVLVVCLRIQLVPACNMAWRAASAVTAPDTNIVTVCLMKIKL